MTLVTFKTSTALHSFRPLALGQVIAKKLWLPFVFFHGTSCVGQMLKRHSTRIYFTGNLLGNKVCIAKSLLVIAINGVVRHKEDSHRMIVQTSLDSPDGEHDIMSGGGCITSNMQYPCINSHAMHCDCMHCEFATVLYYNRTN